jgi:8-oxo-dGTP pyrophosphatase MutT (NUDIX family)
VDALGAALDAYRPRDDHEAADVDRVRRLVERGDPWSRHGALHVTASALVVDPTNRRVLLRWHTRLQQWMQVGGHGDPGETDPWLIALREAREETGLQDLEPLTPTSDRVPVQIVVVPVPAGRDEPAHEHADIRYALGTNEPGRSRAESPGATVCWMDFEGARDRIREPNLLEFVDRVERLLDGSTS